MQRIFVPSAAREKRKSGRARGAVIERAFESLATPAEAVEGRHKNGNSRLRCLSTHSRESPRLVGRAARSRASSMLYMYYHAPPSPPPPWLTIDRLGSGRDIRLSTATMRALEPRRPQLTSTFRLSPRTLFRLLLLLFAFHAVRARSVIRDEEDAIQAAATDRSPAGDRDAVGAATSEKIDAPGQAQGKFAQHPDREPDSERVVSEEADIAGEKYSQADGRSRDPAGASDEPKKIADGRQAGEAPRREDEEASVAKKRRRNDVASIGKSETREAEEEGIRRFDARVDAEGVASGAPGKQDRDEPSREQGTSEEIPNYFRKSGKIEDDDDEEEEEEEAEVASNENSGSIESDEHRATRDHRSLGVIRDKLKEKSSTVYLSAEEKKISDGEQQSIVDGQIRKLISIRDDALDSRKPERIEEAQLLASTKETAMDELAFTREQPRDQDRSKVKHAAISDGKDAVGSASLLSGWKDRAVSLQERIRDRAFVARLREQTGEVLPEIPRFTEKQLLDTLERIVLAKRLGPLNDSRLADVKGLGLTENQLRIVSRAEQLVAPRDRQTFVANLAECIRGLSVLNCMRIFVWPIVLDNLPEPIGQSLANLPIEINVFDLFQGSGQKSARARDLRGIRLLAPDTVVYSILQDALDSYPSDETLVSYIDPKNETLSKLLSADRLGILRMGEKFLPQTLRKEYSDKIFSCVRRFEYYSCVKYFAWPMIKQYFPALPAFPDYQTWYPIIDLSPQYPIFSYPSFAEDAGELPEVVDADAGRTSKPRPEAIIVQVLRNTLMQQPGLPASPSFLDHVADTYVAPMPEDQLLTIDMAQQLIPISRRPEFLEKTVRCMKEYTYLSCFKYWTWPTVRHYVPALPEISSLLPDIVAPRLADIGGYVSEIPSYPSYYWASETAADFDKEPAGQENASRTRANLAQASDELEARLLKILRAAQHSRDSKPGEEASRQEFAASAINFPALSATRIQILKLAEALVPDSSRRAFDEEIRGYLERNGSFVDCARYVIWPTIGKHVPGLPAFPREEAPKESDGAGDSRTPHLNASNTEERIQERGSPSVAQADAESQNGVASVPVISVSGIRFVPIFTDHPEAVILNILRSVQLQSLKTNAGTSSLATKNQQFLDYLTEQQAGIVNVVDALLPENVRPDFANKMLACLRLNNFLACTRDIAWPALTQYFPWLPSFPNFGFLTGPSTTDPTVSTSKPDLTEPGSGSGSDSPPLSETNVKTGLHGDTTVTITDTRFFPILSELPETVILNILRAVQLSSPNFPGAPAPARTQDLSAYLTDQQIVVVHAAENLLPAPSRADFAGKLDPCFRDRGFLECARDIIWPTIARFYPWLPSFPNFGSPDNLPRAPASVSVGFQVPFPPKPSSAPLEGRAPATNSDRERETLLLREAEKKMESLLLDLLKQTPELESSYLNPNDPLASLLTKRQRGIVRLVERGIPDATRPSYVTRTLRCVTRYNFLSCANSIAWPLLKEYVPQLPDLSSVTSIFSELPGLVQNLDAGQIAAIPDLGPWLPGIPQLPGVELPRVPVHFASDGEKYGSTQTPTSVPPPSPTSSTPSVGDQGIVPEYAGQPPGVLVNLQAEQIRERAQAMEAKSRTRRSTMDPYRAGEPLPESTESSPQPFPNITESDYLRLLIRIKQSSRFSVAASSKPKRYLVDALNSTARNSLTADQYEILKIIEELDAEPSGRGLASQVIQCITGLSFIRCLGIFIWPLVVSNLPSLIGLPSFPSFGILGRSADTTESQVEQFFGMSEADFEKELLERKESIESRLLDWYRKLAEEEFQMDVGAMKIKGFGNSELAVGFSGYREARGAKLKDNKNLPSILTIISDIMEEVLDQRPEGEKTKRDKEKKERSVDESRESDIQFLKDSEEYMDIKRSMNDDELVTMFLDKIRTNDSDSDTDSESDSESDSGPDPISDDARYPSSEDAYNAFGVLFGTKLYDKLAGESDAPEEGPIDPAKVLDIVSLESRPGSDHLKLLPAESRVVYDIERESGGEAEARQRQKRGKDLLRALLDERSDKYLKDSEVDRFEAVESNKISDTAKERNDGSKLVIRLPRLHDELLSKKVTNSVTVLGRALNSKMSQMMPGVGLILSFLLQMAVAHARAAASMAGMISNMALGSAMFGMLRDSVFGSNDHPQIKYVYDNDKTGPGIVWPSQSGPHYYHYGH